MALPAEIVEKRALLVSIADLLSNRELRVLLNSGERSTLRVKSFFY